MADLAHTGQCRVPPVRICQRQSGNEAGNERENMVSGSKQQNKSRFLELFRPFSVVSFFSHFSFKRKIKYRSNGCDIKHHLFVHQRLQNGINHARWRRVTGVLLTQREDARRAHRFLPFLYQQALRLTVEIVRQILRHLPKM